MSLGKWVTRNTQQPQVKKLHLRQARSASKLPISCSQCKIILLSATEKNLFKLQASRSLPLLISRFKKLPRRQ